MLLNIFDRNILEVYYRIFLSSFLNNFRFYKNKFNRKTHDVLTQGMKLGGGVAYFMRYIMSMSVDVERVSCARSEPGSSSLALVRSTSLRDVSY